MPAGDVVSSGKGPITPSPANVRIAAPTPASPQTRIWLRVLRSGRVLVSMVPPSSVSWPLVGQPLFATVGTGVRHGVARRSGPGISRADDVGGPGHRSFG